MIIFDLEFAKTSNLILSLIITFILILINLRLKEIGYANVFIVTSIMWIIHTSIEFFDISKDYYALTSSLISILLTYAVLLFHKKHHFSFNEARTK